MTELNTKIDKYLYSKSINIFELIKMKYSMRLLLIHWNLIYFYESHN